MSNDIINKTVSEPVVYDMAPNPQPQLNEMIRHRFSRPPVFRADSEYGRVFALGVGFISVKFMVNHSFGG